MLRGTLASGVNRSITTNTIGDALTRFVTAPIRVQTYKRLAYLLLAFPLGMAYFVGFTAGASTGIGLLVTLLGVPILLVTLLAATAASGLEAYLARALLDRDVPNPAVLEHLDERSLTDPDGGYLAGIKRLLAEPTTWTNIAVVPLKFL
ncbi:MAG: putative sensor, partial [uncultured archaeon A07HR67]